MTVREFFKSTAFKSLAVLLTIVIVAGGLLAICNDLFYISPEERFARSLAKIYGDSATVERTVEVTAENGTFAKGTVEDCYLMSDGNYLVKSVGKDAYKNGTITVWTVIKVTDGKLSGIGKVLFEETSVGSYFGVSDAFLSEFSAYDEAVSEGKRFSNDGDSGIAHPYTGASFSANAFNNAVNTAIDFVNEVCLGVKEEKLPFEDFVNLAESTVTADSATQTVTYSLMMKANAPVPAFRVNVTVKEGVITAYSHEGSYHTKPTYVVDESIVDGTFFLNKTKENILAVVSETGVPNLAGASLTTGATISSSSFLCGGAFALCNYDFYLQGGNVA